MGKFGIDKPAQAGSVQHDKSSDVKGPEGSMPAVTGPDVRQIVGMSGLSTVTSKLDKMCGAMSPMLGRLQVAGKGADYLLA